MTVPPEREDPGSFDGLFRAEFPSVLRSVHLVVGDQELARDITQDAFTKLFVHWRRISRYDRPGAWVRRVAIHDAISATGRRQRRGQAAAAFERQRLTTSPGAPDDRLDQLLGALAQLSVQQRAAVALFYLEDRPVDEVATLMGTAASTVKVHLHRARQRLAEVLQEEDSDAAR